MTVRRSQGPASVGMPQPGKVQHLLPGREERNESMPLMEILLCGVTGDASPCPLSPLLGTSRRQSPLGQAQFSSGIFQRVEMTELA